MPNKMINELRSEINAVKVQLGTTINELKWVRWIIVGAAGIGFLEKLLGWMK